MSNVTRKCYNVVSPSCSVNCATDNVIYLISCKKCGIQYVGETGQTLRKRLNNHRNRLRNMTNLYLYHHFNSDGHSEEDIAIMPIEEITASDKDTCSLSAKRLEREDYWCRELCTFYSYDNVRKVGNISKSIVVNTLFHKQTRKFRKRQPRKRRRKIDLDKLTERLETLLTNYKSYRFCFSVRSLILS